MTIMAPAHVSGPRMTLPTSNGVVDKPLPPGSPGCDCPTVAKIQDGQVNEREDEREGPDEQQARRRDGIGPGCQRRRISQAEQQRYEEEHDEGVQSRDDRLEDDRVRGNTISVESAKEAGQKAIYSGHQEQSGGHDAFKISTTTKNSMIPIITMLPVTASQACTVPYSKAMVLGASNSRGLALHGQYREGEDKISGSDDQGSPYEVADDNPAPTSLRIPPISPPIWSGMVVPSKARVTVPRREIFEV